jgi:DNA-binding NtrC family response regulator
MRNLRGFSGEPITWSVSIALQTGPFPDHVVQTGPLPDQADQPLPATAATAAPLSVLVLEDDPQCSDLLVQILEHEGASPFVCPTVSAARQAVSRRDFDLYILDSRLPDGSGAGFYYFLLDKCGHVPAIMLTGLPELSTAVELTKTGLLNYLTKPYSLVQLRACLAQALAHRQRQPARRDHLFTSVSSCMQPVYNMARQAAANPSATVLITGETGVGKDVLARTIHRLTHAGEKPFVSLNCATLPADMFEAELFGAERGAYTGAMQTRAGLTEAAGDGTLFLDEIAEVPIQLQAKLLHLLERREFRRLGSPASRKFGGRIIAATNRPLETAVQEGRFRADLLYRLDIFAIEVPPLRLRKEDLPVLCDAILTELAQRSERTRPQFKYEDLQLLQSYLFPGNIRELRNILERSLVSTPASSAWLQLDALSKARLQRAPASIESSAPLATVRSSEYEVVREALRAENGAIRRAAARLGLSHQSLLRRLKKWPELRVVS